MKLSKLVLLGLTLVAVPLLFQFALLYWMSGILSSIQEESEKARDSRMRSTQLSECLLKCGDFMFLLTSAGKNSKESDVLKEIDAIERESIELLEGTSRDSKTVKQVEKAKAALHDLVLLSPTALTTGRTGSSLEERLSITPRLFKASNKYTAEVTALIEMERNSQPQDHDIAPAVVDKVRDLLLISIAVSILFSIIMAIFFAARIKGPINRISKNLALLSEHKPLLSELPWKDELGALDRLIHTVADEANRTLLRERSLIEKASDLICSLDETGKFLTANPMARRMLLMQPSELTEVRLSELVIPEDSFSADELVRRSISLNDFQNAELKLTRADGTTVDTRWSCLWSDREGQLFCVAHDITKERELAQVKEDFMNMITHDLRSPLTSILGGLTILGTGIKGELTPELKEETESAIRSSEKLVSFINDLLDFQKLNTGEMPLNLKENNVRELIDEVIQIVSAHAKERSIELVYETEKPDWTIYCDRQKIVQVLLNLLSNAIKFSPKQSVVLITTKDKPDAIRFSVADCGPGVPEDMRKKIFEPFEQMQSTQHQGTGLGLAICKMIVDTHGGSIGVTDRRSPPSATTEHEHSAKGSEFWFEIENQAALKDG